MRYLLLLSAMYLFFNPVKATPDPSPWMQTDTTEKKEEVDLPFPFKDNQEGINKEKNGMYLKNPSNF